MPRRTKNTEESTALNKNISYRSLLVGVITVIILIVLVVFAIKFVEKRAKDVKETESITSGEMIEEKLIKKTYTVKEGDTLWSIAQQFYNSGYNFVDIANENKIENPNEIEKDTVLVIPDVAPRLISKISAEESAQGINESQPKIETDTYTVLKGDNLWQIAVRAYGDGFKWVDIAKANSLVNPSFIHAGNVFIIPR